MPSPRNLPDTDTERTMRAPVPTSARSIADFFHRALSSFQSSGSKLQVICTAAPAPHRDTSDHGQPAPLPPHTRPRTLIVLDSSFNPPTRAHLRMATSAIQDLTQKQGQTLDSMRLLLLLSIANADKGVKPAAFDKRLAMMWAFAKDVQQSLRREGGLVSTGGTEDEDGQALELETLGVDIGLAAAPYFHEKSAALAEGRFYRGTGDPSGAGETEQVFLVGYDTLIRIFNPKYYGPLRLPGPGKPTPMQEALDPFFGRAKLRVTMRTGDEWGEADDQRAFFQDLLRAEGMSKVGGSEEWGSRIEMVESPSAGADIISSTYARAAARDRDSGKLDTMVTPGVRWWIEHDNLYTE